MKIFQIKDSICFYDATRVHPDLLSTLGKYPPDVLFAEAPDNVFEGWGYDETKEGDERFIQPEPPEGWAYDANTGTFYPIDQEPVEAEPTTEEILDTLLGVSE